MATAFWEADPTTLFGAKFLTTDFFDEFRKQVTAIVAADDLIRFGKTDLPTIIGTILSFDFVAHRFYNGDVLAFAEGWARQHAKDAETNPAASSPRMTVSQVYNYFRRAACDFWFQASKTMSIEQLNRLFNGEILVTLAAMDRANALYAMRLKGSAEPGMHWFSDRQKEADETLKRRLDGYTGFATCNKQYHKLALAVVMSNESRGLLLDTILQPVLLHRLLNEVDQAGTVIDEKNGLVTDIVVDLAF